ncbi:MAG: tetratricopeptide repeat protein [Candidatus Binataceae bacterium]
MPYEPTDDRQDNVAPAQVSNSLLSRARWLVKRESAAPAALLLATLLVYLRALADGFVSDDQALIVNNPNLAYWSFLWKSLFHDLLWFEDPAHLPITSHYRPLLLVWFGLNYHLFGLRPAWWHAAMVAAHLIVVYLVYKVALRLVSDRFAALSAALLFGLLAVHAEAVVWAAGFGLVMAGGFQLGAFYLVMEPAHKQRGNWLCALSLYMAALFSHESAVVFPALVGAWAWFLGPQPVEEAQRLHTAGPRAGSLRFSRWMAAARRAAVLAVPFALETALYMLARRMVLGFWISDPRAPAAAGLREDLLTLPRVIAAYLEMLSVPWSAGPAHGVTFVTSARAAAFLWPLAALVGIGALFWILVRNDPRRPLYLFCVAWVAIALAPVLSLGALVKDHLVHDNYLYLSSMGWCLMLGDLAARLERRGPLGRRLAWGGVGTAALVCAAALWQVQALWHDDVTLSRYGARVFPNSVPWRIQLADSLVKRGDFAAAEREFERALSLDPADGQALYSLGFVHFKQGRVKTGAAEAAEGLRRMIGHLSSNLYVRESSGAYIRMAQLYDLAEDAAHRDAALNHAASLPGGLPDAELARAELKRSHGDLKGAEAIQRELALRYPAAPRVWVALGITLAAQNRNQEALAAYERVLRTIPAEPAINFLAATTLHALGRDDEALAHCRRVLAVAPGDPRTLALMAEINRSAAPH